MNGPPHTLARVGCQDMDWNHLAQDTALWQALVNQVSESSAFTKGGQFLNWLLNAVR
jgi:hypothetical protein